MKPYESIKELNAEELRQKFWYYLSENPTNITLIIKQSKLSARTLEDLLDPDNKRKFGMTVLLKLQRFLLDKYKERDEEAHKAKDAPKGNVCREFYLNGICDHIKTDGTVGQQ